MQAIDRTIHWITFFLAAIAGLALVLIALTIMAEVTMRALRWPLVGAHEVIRITFVASVFFAFAHVIVQQREIRVDVLRHFFPPLLQRALDAFACVVTICFFGFLLWFGYWRLQDNWLRGVYLEGRLLIPMWIPWGMITIGAALAVMASFLSLVKYALGYSAPRYD